MWLWTAHCNSWHSLGAFDTAGTTGSTLQVLSHLIVKATTGDSTAFITILQMRKLRQNEVNKCRNWDANPGSHNPEPMFLMRTASHITWLAQYKTERNTGYSLKTSKMVQGPNNRTHSRGPNCSSAALLFHSSNEGHLQTCYPTATSSPGHIYLPFSLS